MRTFSRIGIVVEVADTSLSFDRDVKLPLYAAADIPEVWLVDLEADTIHVYRDPSDDRYTDHDTYGPDDELDCSSLPALTPIAASDILPPPQSNN